MRKTRKRVIQYTFFKKSCSALLQKHFRGNSKRSTQKKLLKKFFCTFCDIFEFCKFKIEIVQQQSKLFFSRLIRAADIRKNTRNLTPKVENKNAQILTFSEIFCGKFEKYSALTKSLASLWSFTHKNNIMKIRSF